MQRNPNTKCKKCEKPTYKSPFAIESYGDNLYCSRKCMFDDRKKLKTCPICEVEFQSKPKQIYCSKVCSGKATRNRTGTKKGFRKQKCTTHTRLEVLKEKFDFKCCMVKGCNYDKCYDIHRLIEGKNGGTYTIGNMFAICPNHHAESHRGIIVLVKISDCELKIRKRTEVV